MAAPGALSNPVPSAVTGEVSTRERILDLVVRHGPISSSELAEALKLTPAAVRRHTIALEEDELIREIAPSGPAVPRRGRPPRLFVATRAGQARLTNAYSDIATASLRYLEELIGSAAVEDFARTRYAVIFQRYQPVIDAAGADPRARATALAAALSDDGYAATIREVGDGFAVQLCQGHCPVLRVAQEYPQLCVAETEAFGELLGLHVQRLATLAAGEHVCTMNIPLMIRAPKGQE